LLVKLAKRLEECSNRHYTCQRCEHRAKCTKIFDIGSSYYLTTEEYKGKLLAIGQFAQLDVI